MFSMNQTIISGRVIEEPEYTALHSGDYAIAFALEVSNGEKGRRCVIDCERYLKSPCELVLKAGEHVFVVGKLKSFEYHLEGKKISRTKVQVSRVHTTADIFPAVESPANA